MLKVGIDDKYLYFFKHKNVQMIKKFKETSAFMIALFW
jgi:hypothetical protein